MGRPRGLREVRGLKSQNDRSAGNVSGGGEGGKVREGWGGGWVTPLPVGWPSEGDSSLSQKGVCGGVK